MAEQKRLEEEKEAPVFGDVLEKVMSYVPLVDLVSASQVSRAWNDAVSSSLRHVSVPKPWLILHAQSTRPPYAAAVHAYDPRTGDWLRRREPPAADHLLRSSHSTLLFTLSPTSLAFSTDALRLRWTRVAPPPLVSGTDPVVASVGRRVVVAGGGCDFGGDPVPVEVYCSASGAWSACGTMPAPLEDAAAASTALSVAVRGGEAFVVEKSSGLAFAFDPAAMTWRGPYDLRRGGEVDEFCTVAEFCGDGGLVAVGLVGSPESVRAVILRKFRGECLEAAEALGEMPRETLERLKGESSRVPSVSLAAKGSFVFMLNPSGPRVVIQCEIVGGGCRWACVRNDAVDDSSWIMQRLMLGCADVAIEDLRRAMATEGVSFVAEGSERARF